jgi:hypothetical protein
LLCVFLQAPIAHFDVPELALDHTERMLDLGSDASLEFLSLINEFFYRVTLVQRLAFAWLHRDVPLGFVASAFCALVNALVAGVA